MAIIGGRIAALILSRYEWRDASYYRAEYQAENKIESLLGTDFWNVVRGKTVLDFGCGEGREALAIARSGAAEVIGIDIREEMINRAKANQATSGITNCSFATQCDRTVDVVVSLDSFEHFGQPDLILKRMAELLAPNGRVVFSFGPPWFHPLGGHFPLFPWAHLLITEKALMKWRSKYKTDNAKRFGEVEGGLNQMSIRKFQKLVGESPLAIERLETVPIRAARAIHCRLTREYLSSVVRGSLVHR